MIVETRGGAVRESLCILLVNAAGALAEELGICSKLPLPLVKCSVGGGGGGGGGGGIGNVGSVGDWDVGSGKDLLCGGDEIGQ